MPKRLDVVFKRAILRIASQEAGKREDNEITGLAGKTSRYGKTKTYFEKPSKWLKRVILREQDSAFLF